MGPLPARRFLLLPWVGKPARLFVNVCRPPVIYLDVPFHSLGHFLSNSWTVETQSTLALVDPILPAERAFMKPCRLEIEFPKSSYGWLRTRWSSHLVLRLWKASCWYIWFLEVLSESSDESLKSLLANKVRRFLTQTVISYTQPLTVMRIPKLGMAWRFPTKLKILMTSS